MVWLVWVRSYTSKRIKLLQINKIIMNYSIFKLAKSFKGGIVLGLTAILIVSGFFVANLAQAAHTTTVNLDRTAVMGGVSRTYNFTVTNNGADKVYKIVIAAPAGFTITIDPTCPSGWLASHTASEAQCLTDGNPSNTDLLASGSSKPLSFSATSANPGTDTTYTWNVTTTDNAWGSNLNTNAQTRVDVTVPTILSITTKDLVGGDGKVDTATIIFSEPVLDSSFAAGNFSIGGSAGTSILTGTADDNTFDVVVAGGVVGTEAKDVLYTQGAGSDIVGNLLANVVTGTIVEIDEAKPVFMSARTISPAIVEVTFSENIPTTYSKNDFGVGGNSSSNNISSASNPEGDNTIILNLSSAIGTGDTPQVYYNSTWSGGIKDAALNVVVTKDLTSTDGIKPNIVSSRTLTTTTIQVTFSEAMSAVDKVDFAVAGNLIDSVTFTAPATTATLVLHTPIGTGDTPQVSTIVSPANTKDNPPALNVITGSLTSAPIDGIAPTVVLTSAVGSYFNVATFSVTATFSENVTGFSVAVGDITVTNGTAGTFDGSGAVYTFDITPTGQGAVTVNIPAAAAQDLVLAPNNNTQSNTISTIFDNIVPTAPTVLTPNGGNYLKGGASYNITWTPTADANPGATPIKIEYSPLGTFADTETLAAANNNSGSYSWLVPAPNLNTAKIRITATDLAGNHSENISATAFTIDSINPTIQTTTLLTPSDGGINLKGGQSYNITWTTGNIIDTNLGGNPITIQYASDGSTYVDVITGLANSGSYTWAVPPSNLSTAKIKIIATDLAGNSNEDVSDNAFLIDSIAPTITATAPAASISIKEGKVSYTLSEAAAAGTGVIVFTGTAGSDNGVAHTCTLQGTALEAGAHTDLVLATNANACVNWATSLVDGSTYTVTFNSSDAAGNPATQVSNASVKFDTTAPTGTVTKGTSTIYEGDLVQEVTVTYNENMDPVSTPTITFGATTGVWTSGVGSWTAANVWQQNFTITDANEERTGVTINSSLAQDLAGNVEGADVQATFNIDTLTPTAPTLVTFTATGGTVIANTVNTTNTNFTGGATITAGQATGGVAHWLIGDVPFATPINDATILVGDSAVTFTAGLSSNVAVQAQIASGASTLSVQLCDAAGNCSTSSGGDNKAITADYVVPTITSTAPATNAFIKTETVSYALSEAAVAASGVIVFTQTSGSADGNSPHACVLQETALNSGAHAGLVLATGANACVSWANPLVSSAIYTVTFNASDAAGNPATMITNTGVTFDNVAPTGTVTVDTATIYEGDLDQGVTVTYNEDMKATPTPTITFGATTGGITPGVGNWDTVRIWHRHFTITDANEETTGVTINSSLAQDLAGNAEGADTQATFDIDTLAPTAPTIGVFTATGGTVIATYINSTNTGFTLKFTSPGANYAGTAHLYSGGALLGTDVTFAVVAGATEYTLTGDATSITQLGADGAKSLTVKIIDAAGNVSAASAASGITKDTVVPIFASVALGADEYVNAAETAAGVNIVITTTGLENGRTVSCTITGTSGSVGPVTGLVDSNAVTIASTALTALADGTITATCSVSDAAGNPAVNGTDNATKDVGIPDAPVITHIAGDEKINNAEKAAIVVTGTAEANALVSVTLTNGANSRTGTQQLSGGATAFSITIDGTAATPAPLADGTITPSVTATDVAGNVSAAVTTPTALKDTVAPVFTINNGAATGPVQSDTINLTVTEINPATSKYGFSADNICNDSDTISTDFISGVDFSIVGNHTDYLCAKATDTSGNITYPYQLVGQLNTDNTNPALVLGSLFTGQTLTGGHVYPINWTSSDLHFSATPIKLEYSIDDGGGTWNTIIASTENDGVYAWSVPTAINSSWAEIRITAIDLAGNANSNVSSVFTIAYSETPDTTPPVVTLNSPNGAESWAGGSSHVITWTATDNVTPAGSIAIKLEYSTDGSITWHDIIISTDNDGAYLWTVASTVTTNALIKVTATDAATNVGSDLSNAVFTITAQPPVTICTDAGGGNWNCSIALSIGWNLVSLPVIISNTAIANVLSGISNYTVQYYDTVTNSWKAYNGSSGDLTTMEDGKGYWINKTTAPATLTVTGTKSPAAPDHTPTYSVLSGWNLIGFKSTISQLTSTYLQTLPVSSYTLLNAGNENKNSGNMDSGNGYWLWMNTTGSIVTYSE